MDGSIAVQYFKTSGHKEMEAAFQHKLRGGKVRCDLCPHHCVLAEGDNGLCKARGVRGGELLALCYGVISSAALDPVEKKPLYHFYPGRMIYSIGGWGCNFECSFCQNWTISQQIDRKGRVYTPDHAVREAVRLTSIGIAYTYNEPLVGFEYVRDCAIQVRRAGLVNVLVTNGYVASEPAAELLPLIDALNIDIKSMADGFYRDTCHGRLEPVLRFAKQAVDTGCHVEITNLVIPGMNDQSASFEKLAGWICDNLGRKTPLHLSAYRPEYMLRVGATSPSLLEEGHDICRRYLDYVYIGNVRTDAGQNTGCPKCGKLLIERRGYLTKASGIKNGKCAICGRPVDAVGL